MEFETADNTIKSAARRSFELARKEARIDDMMEKDGFRTLYSCQEHDHEKDQTRSIKILEYRNHFLLMVEGKAIHTADTLAECVRRSMAAGYLNKSEAEKLQPAISAKTTPAARSAAAPKLTPGPKYQPPKKIQETQPQCKRLSLNDRIFSLVR